jgi:DNA-binding beta-propeller fold protein YncE
MAVSPGGGSFYATSMSSDAVAVFRRGPRGALRQLKGRAACVSLAARHGCGRARALRDPFAIVVSPDGRNVYAGSWAGQAIAAFSRNPKTGALRQLRGRAGCVTGAARAGCATGRALGNVASLTLSPNGRFLYVGTTAGIAAFRRDARSGRLVQLSGTRGCVTAAAVQGCARGRSLTGAAAVAVDRGGDNLYAAGGSVAVFGLDRGAPRQLAGAAGCINEGGTDGCAPARWLNGPASLAVSPGGGQVYASAEFSAAVAIFSRAGATGALTQRPGPLGCIRESTPVVCANARHLEHPGQLELSHDGANVYVVGRGVVSVLRRDRATGALSQLPGKRGCLNSLSRPGARFPDCTDSGRVNPLGITLSRDGRSAYIVDTETGVIAVYRRAR